MKLYNKQADLDTRTHMRIIGAMENMKSEKRNTLTYVLLALYLLALTWLILFKLQFTIPDMQEGRVINMIPFMGLFGDNSIGSFAEIRNNILAFIPLGIYICMLKSEWSISKKVFAIVALTLAYELAQFIFAIGRADITDVLSNTLGGIIGIGIYALLSKFLKCKTNKIINLLAAVFTSFAFIIIALLLISHRWVIIK